MLPNPYMLLGAIGLAAVGFGAGWQVREWRCDAAVAEVLKDAVKAGDEAEADVAAAATDYEDIRANITESAVTERTVVREIYRDIEVPADCAVDPAARGVLDAARNRANAATSGELGERLPAPAGGASAVD